MTLDKSFEILSYHYLRCENNSQLESCIENEN